MSIRKILSVLIISAEVMGLSACSGDPAAVIVSPRPRPRPVKPPSSTPPASVTHNKGFIWSVEDGFEVIPTPSYAESMRLTGINNLGQVIGHLTLHDVKGDYRGFIWSANDGLQRLGSLVGPEGLSMPLTIDDNGEVRGLSEGPSTGAAWWGGLDIEDEFVWTAGAGMKPATSTRFDNFKPVSDGGKLVLPAGTDCMVLVRATTAGFAIGYAGSRSKTGTCIPMSALMWEVDGTPVVIGPPCDNTLWCDVQLSDINNHGVVIGSNAGGYGFRWTRSGGTVGVPLENGFVTVINDNGDAAGSQQEYGSGAFFTPFVWTASGEIKTIELPSGATFKYVAGINNRGQVVGGFQ